MFSALLRNPLHVIKIHFVATGHICDVIQFQQVGDLNEVPMSDFLNNEWIGLFIELLAVAPVRRLTVTIEQCFYDGDQFSLGLPK